MQPRNRQRSTTSAILVIAALIGGVEASRAYDAVRASAPFTLSLPEGWRLAFEQESYQLVNGSHSWSVLFYPKETAPSSLEELVLVQESALMMLFPGTTLTNTIPIESKAAHMRTYRLANVPAERSAFMVAGAVLERGAIGINGSVPDDPTLAALKGILLSARSK